MLATILYPRDFNDRAHFQEAEEAWKELREHADENRFHGFVEVVMAEGFVEGFQQLLQLAYRLRLKVVHHAGESAHGGRGEVLQWICELLERR